MKQPNILFIMTDQQRWNSLGCHGSATARTPNIDALAASGVSFDRYYCANPICTPNRISLFSGMYPRSHGVFTNGLEPNGERPTIAAHLSAHGYRTASIGKIHFTPFGGRAGNMESGHLWSESPQLARTWNGPYWGFDHVELTIGHTQPIAHYGRWFSQQGGTPDMLEINRPATLPAEASGTGTTRVPASLHSSSFVGTRTVEWLEQRDRSTPFFLVASFPDPHGPFDPPEEVAARFDPHDVTMPIREEGELASRPQHYRDHFRGAWHRRGLHDPQHPEGIDEATTRHRIAYTDAMVSLVDDNVGKILAYLEDSGERENTIVVFTTDHGELLGDHGLWAKGPFFYEQLVRLPLIVSVPGGTSGKTDNLLSTVDIVPTLCDLAGIDVPYWVDGVSAASTLRGDEVNAAATRDECLIEYRTGYEWTDEISAYVVVGSDRKYVRYRSGSEELTDLVADPLERTNIVADVHESERNAWRERLIDVLKKTEPRWPRQITHA